MVFHYIMTSSSKTDSEKHGAIQKYLSLSNAEISAYTAIKSDDYFLQWLEHLLHIQIYVMKTKSGILSGSIYHINPEEFDSSNLLYTGKNTFLSLRVIFLELDDNGYNLLVPKHHKQRCVQVKDIPNVAKTLLNIPDDTYSMSCKDNREKKSSNITLNV